MKPEGIFLIDKPAGVTSFQLLSPIKNAYKAKVGHGGTLDKFATGLMIVLVGRWTRLADLFSGLDKSYRGTVLFGEETDTLDPEGEIIKTANTPSQHILEGAIANMQGVVEQIPPAYSAIHIDGKRAWKRIRGGEVFEMPSRRVSLYRVELERWESPRAEIFVHCSKGTYIRSIARDLGEATNSAARLDDLRRLSIGSFSVEDAYRPEELMENLPEPSQSRSLFQNLPGVETITIPQKDLPLVRMGKALDPERFHWLSEGCQQAKNPMQDKAGLQDNPVEEYLEVEQKSTTGDYKPTRLLLFTEQDKLVASIQLEDKGWRYHFVVPE